MKSKVSVQQYIDDIKRIKVEPGIFNVYLMGAGHRSGYDAWVSFRTYSTTHPWMSECRTHGDTPEEALYRLLVVLTQITNDTCPHCGEKLDTESE